MCTALVRTRLLHRASGRPRYAYGPFRANFSVSDAWLQHELPYPLLSDRKRELITALGAGEGGKTQRSHFIFAKGGKLIDKKIPVKAADRQVGFYPFTFMELIFLVSCSPKIALEFIKSQ